jgi:hypothetical protein
MDQLTQMELLQIHELLSAEELAVKKCQAYADVIKDDELAPYIQQSISLHQKHVTDLLEQVRQHNGKGEVRQ